jgi:hypothetical protein
MFYEVCCVDSSTIFQKMLRQSESLLDQGFTEYSVIHCHVTLDYFINIFLETNFLTELTPIKTVKRDIHRLFIEATWEEEKSSKFVSFIDKYGKYVRSLGFDFKSRNEYSELKKMNVLRNDIIHNRTFASDISAVDARDFIGLCRRIIDIFKTEFSSSYAFILGSEMTTKCCFVDQDFEVSASRISSKKTDLIVEACSLLHATEKHGVLILEDIGIPKTSDFRYFSLRVCEIEYLRYGANKPNKAAALRNLEPQWFNGQALSIFLNLNFHEIARGIESSLELYQSRIKLLIEDLVLNECKRLVTSWSITSFVNKAIFSSLLSFLFNLSYLGESPSLKHFLTHEWRFLSATGEEDDWSYLTLNEIKGSDGRKIYLHDVQNPAEMDFVRRFAYQTNFLEESAIIFIPQAYPFFVGNFFESNSILIELITEFLSSSTEEKEIKQLTNQDLIINGKYFRFPANNIFSVGSQYDRYIVENSALKYICERINGYSYINKEHDFCRRIMDFASGIGSDDANKIYAFLEEINDALDGRRWHFSNFIHFGDKLSKLLLEVDFPDKEELSQSLSEEDFPPGFFVWEKKYVPESVIVSQLSISPE